MHAWDLSLNFEHNKQTLHFLCTSRSMNLPKKVIESPLIPCGRKGGNPGVLSSCSKVQCAVPSCSKLTAIIGADYMGKLQSGLSFSPCS